MDAPLPFLPSRLQLQAAEPYRIPQFERAGYLRLDVNEHPGGAPEFVVQAVHHALTPQTLATYPVYAEWHQQAAQFFGVTEDQLTCTSGGDEAIKAICEAHLLAGKSLVTVAPGYDMFAIWARVYGNPLVTLPLGTIGKPEDFAFDPQAWLTLLQAQHGQIGMVALVTPNNPTGTLIPRQTIVDTLDLLAGIPVVVDETYCEFVGQTHADLLAQYPQLFIIRSFSKVHGLAGLRVGAVLSQAQNIEALRRVLNPFNVNRAAVAASLAVMARPDHCAQHVANITAARTTFVAAMQDLGLRCGPATANFVVVELGTRCAEVTAALAREGILIRNRTGTHPALDGWCRIAVGTPAQMQRTAATLRKHLQPAPALAALVWDVDGVLVDVQNSYRQAIVATAQQTLRDLGRLDAADRVDAELVETFKRRGGLNNDWECTAAIVAELRGAGSDNDPGQAAYETLVASFQGRYWGSDGHDGLIAAEPFLVQQADLQLAAKTWKMAVVTGRPRQEALWTLQRAGVVALLGPLYAMEDGPGKPDPTGMQTVLGQLGVLAAKAGYLGDSVDDMRAAKAAGMVALGVLPPGPDGRPNWLSGLADRLYAAGADAVFASAQEALAWAKARN